MKFFRSLSRFIRFIYRFEDFEKLWGSPSPGWEERTIYRYKFRALVGKGQLIEKEWQEMEQNVFDTDFANQVQNGKHNETMAFRRGVIEGVKWCVKRFS